MNIKYILHLLDLIDIYIIFYPTAESTFLSITHRSFSRTDNMTGCKTSLSKFKMMKMIPSVLSDHNGIKLEITNNRRARKF